MPRPKVYGKRTRAVYDLAAANLSSPEQQCDKMTSTTAGEDNELVKVEERKRQSDRTERRALGERNNNSVVLPAEVLRYAEADSTPKARPRARRKEPTISEEIRDEMHQVIQKSPPTKRRPWKAAEEEIEPTSRRTSPRKKHTPKPVLEPAISDSKPTSPSKNRDATIAGDTVQRRSARNSPSKKKIQPPQSEDQVAMPLQTDPPLPSNPFQEHCLPLLNLTSHPLTSFDTWAKELISHFNITKIAEASFGEVYRLSLLHDLPDISHSDESVFKIIPLRAPPPDKSKRQEAMSQPSDVATEVLLLQRMSAIPGFTNFRDLRIVQGRPPPPFVKAFKAWYQVQRAAKKDLSHFPDPSRKANYRDTQLWAVIEMQDAGTDLERLVEHETGACTSIWAVWDVFWHVVLALAKGEEGAEFEHRDLHLGNICVRGDTMPPDNIDTNRKLGFTQLEPTIIDYTLSRCRGNTDNIAFTDLALDAALFEGDASEDYQYAIYRYMRGVLYFDDALHEHDDAAVPQDRDWEQFHPATNLVWLHLVLYKMLEQVEWPSAMGAPTSKKKAAREKWKRAQELENVLRKVADLLEPNAVCKSEVWSAGDLVLLALGEGWLDEADVVGHHDAAEEQSLISQFDSLKM